MVELVMGKMKMSGDYDSIVQAIAKNRAELDFLRKNPITDFFSFRERSRIVRMEIRKELDMLLKTDPRESRYDELVRALRCYPQQCLAAIEEARDSWIGDEKGTKTVLLLMSGMDEPKADGLRKEAEKASKRDDSEKQEPPRKGGKKPKKKEVYSKDKDHRKLGRELDLFMMHESSPGTPFFLPKGTIVYNSLLGFLREEYRRRGYQEVITPLMYDKKLWETSGHWDHFKEHMFNLEVDEREFSLKPMNCPSHLLIYMNSLRSYRDLPLRIADFAVLHRNEPTGSLTGMTRVRKFSQDDSHIFVTPEQLKDELIGLIDFMKYIYERVFKFEYTVDLSTKPSKAMGSDEQWSHAEKALAEALQAKSVPYGIKEGEGAFYGPKIDIQIKDSHGRNWQCGTIQLDFQMPARFGATYEGADGEKHTPIMIHRALLGTLERFMGVLIEHYGGAMPLWLSPLQVSLLPVNDGHSAFAHELRKKMENAGLRVAVDESMNTIGYRIRKAQMEKVPYMLVIGDKEMSSGTLQVRTRKGEISNEKTDDFIKNVVREVEEKA
ncbi:threonine--tRNA ligase [Candidatus Micrarchaeota archaeon]|nr:MAG: threonine--tRNA ligase [Candidatus Micrarchaeota archaeon]